MKAKKTRQVPKLWEMISILVPLHIHHRKIVPSPSCREIGKKAIVAKVGTRNREITRITSPGMEYNDRPAPGCGGGSPDCSLMSRGRDLKLLHLRDPIDISRCSKYRDYSAFTCKPPCSTELGSNIINQICVPSTQVGDCRGTSPDLTAGKTADCWKDSSVLGSDLNSPGEASRVVSMVIARPS